MEPSPGDGLILAMCIGALVVGAWQHYRDGGTLGTPLVALGMAGGLGWLLVSSLST